MDTIAQPRSPHWQRRLQHGLLRQALVLFARLKTQGRSRRLLLGFGLAFGLAGSLFLVAPVYFAGLLGITGLLPAGVTDIRAFYGAMTVAFGVYFVRESLAGASARPGLWTVVVFAGGSALGRLAGMLVDHSIGFLHLGLLAGEASCVWFAWTALQSERRRQSKAVTIENPVKLEDFQPLSAACLENPYPFYKAMREQCPVYRAPGNDFYYVSRYEDIRDVAMNTEDYSSNLVAILFASVDGDTRMVNQPKSGNEQLPVDVLAIQDPPRHGTQRKLGLKNLSLRYVESLEPAVRAKASAIMDRFIVRGECDWVQEFAKEIPMTVALELVGFPVDNWRDVKAWCD